MLNHIKAMLIMQPRFYAAQLLSVSFGAIFGSAWINLENQLPLSAKVSTKIMICYFIMWLIQVPFAFIQSVPVSCPKRSQP